jgi:hypothetical protein
MTDEQPREINAGLPASSHRTPAHIWRNVVWDWLIVLPVAWLVVQLPVHKIGTLYLCMVIFVLGMILAMVVLHETGTPGRPGQPAKPGSLPLAVYTGISGMAVAGWTAYARLTGEHHLAVFTALAGIGVVMVPVGAAVWGRWAAKSAEPPAVEVDPAERQRLADLKYWTDLAAEFGLRDVHAVEINTNRAGRTVTWKLTGRTTREILAEMGQPIAARRQLSRDKVAFTEGPHAGLVIMHLNETDVLKDTILFTEPDEWLTVTRPLTLGIRQDGEPLLVLLREIMVMLIGVTRSGKSNVLHVLIALLVHCTDATVWLIDFKGGRTANPWIQPWAANPGQVRHPAIDWVATTRPEAAKMLRCAVTWAQTRMDSGAGGSKHLPTPAAPQLWIFIDEASRVTGTGVRAEDPEGVTNAKLAALVDDLGTVGAGEAIGILSASQRGTGDFSGAMMFKTNAMLRIVLRAATANDAGYTTDDGAVNRLLASLKHPGTGVLWRPKDTPPLAGKFLRLDPSDETPGDREKILRMAARCGPIRPGPEPAAVAAMDALEWAGPEGKTQRNAYTTRWDYCPMYQRLLPGRPDPVVPTAPARGTPGTQTVTDDQVDTRFADIIGAIDDDDAPEPEIRVPGKTPREAMYDYLATVPTIGGMPAEILGYLDQHGHIGGGPNGHENMRRYIRRWLAADLRAGKVTKTPSGRYVLTQSGGQAA